MKLYRAIIIILTAILLVDGFRGEFRNPTIYDGIKWSAWAILCIVYLYAKKVRHK